MRVCLYNLMDGGVGRADPLAEVLQAQGADVVLLTEAHDPDVRQRLARRLRMNLLADGSAAALVVPQLTPAASLHHLAIRRTSCRRGGLLELRWASPPGPTDAPVTARPAHNASAARQPSHAPDPIAVDVLPEWQLFVVDGHERALLPEGIVASVAAGATCALLAGTLEGTSVAELGTLAGSGWAEVAVPPNWPTQRPTSAPDRLLVKGASVKAVRLETDRLATYASDHYPVVFELTLR
ncbi:MAG: hypothetical protein ACK4PI_03800 [Tepidisphaerales bacterium]